MRSGCLGIYGCDSVLVVLIVVPDGSGAECGAGQVFGGAGTLECRH